MIAPEKRNIADIKIGERHRRDFGDLQGLADSIKTEGLLQAIGITPEDELVFGERRLRACRDILKWEEIDVRIVNVSGIVAGEFAENAIRKDFTVSERVAIMETLARPHGDQRRSADLPIVGKAAEMAGFSSARVATDARRIVREAAPELVEAMDAGKFSINAAAHIAKLPVDEQREVVAQPIEQVRERVAALRAPNRRVTGPGSTSSRQKTSSMKLPMSVKQAATRIMNNWPPSMVRDLIAELQSRVDPQKVTAEITKAEGQPVAVVAHVSRGAKV